MDTHTHIHTYTQDNYSNPRCACAPRVNIDVIIKYRWPAEPRPPTWWLAATRLLSYVRPFHGHLQCSFTMVGGKKPGEDLSDSLKSGPRQNNPLSERMLSAGCLIKRYFMVPIPAL